MTENTPADSATVFRDDDQLADPGYRRINVWAFAALVAGLLSVLSLVSPLFWVVPLAAFVFAALALHAIRGRENELGGRKPALFGMMCATVFLSSSVTTYYVHGQLVVAHAQVHANSWFELIRAHKVEIAHQLRQTYKKRAPAGTNLADYYRTANQQELLVSFLRETAVEKILRLGADAKLTYLSNSFVTRENPTTDAVALWYRLESTTGAEPPAVVEIQLTRESFDVARECHWTVRSVTIVPDAT